MIGVLIVLLQLIIKNLCSTSLWGQPLKYQKKKPYTKHIDASDTIEKELTNYFPINSDQSPLLLPISRNVPDLVCTKKTCRKWGEIFTTPLSVLEWKFLGTAKVDFKCIAILLSNIDFSTAALFLEWGGKGKLPLKTPRTVQGWEKRFSFLKCLYCRSRFSNSKSSGIIFVIPSC